MAKSHTKINAKLILSLLMAALSACNVGTKWNDIEFYNVEKLDKVSEKLSKDNTDDELGTVNDSCEHTVDVSVNMQFMKSDNELNENICHLINATLLEVILKQPGELDVDEAINQYIAERKEELLQDEFSQELYDRITGTAQYGRQDIITYRVDRDMYTGGAHPFTITTYLNFNALTGEFIELENVFPSSRHDEIKEMLTQKLISNLGRSSLEEIQKDGYLDMCEMFVTTNFALRPDSIEFIYNQYEIAPYYCGASTICLSYDELQDIISSAIMP